MRLDVEIQTQNLELEMANLNSGVWMVTIFGIGNPPNYRRYSTLHAHTPLQYRPRPSILLGIASKL
jgi:hypothetical protein